MDCYLDNSATTCVSSDVAAYMVDVMTNSYGNPSSLHHRGFEAEQILRKARDRVATVLKVKPEEIIFTSGGTEANNIAILGAAHGKRRKGNKIITSAIEHHSVISTMEFLESEGFDVTYLKPDSTGRISPEAVLEHMDDHTVLVSIMTVNSESGAENDIPSIAKSVKSVNPDCLVHTDAVQAFAKRVIPASKWNVDLLSCSGHKIHASKGVGALYVKSGTHLVAPLHGSHQEKGLRPGTENVPGIAGFGLASALWHENQSVINTHLSDLRRHLVSRLETMNGVFLNSPDDAVPYIINLSMPGFRSEILIHYLESLGIYVSSGSACAKGAKSHVLTAMGFDDDRIDSAIRVSLTDTSTQDEIDYFCDSLFTAQSSITKKR